MAKNKTTKAGQRPPKRATKKIGNSKRLDPADYGIDLAELLEQIKPRLEGMPQAEIGEAANLKPMVVSHLMTGYKSPSLGAPAAMTKPSGGRLVVKYEPPKAK